MNENPDKQSLDFRSLTPQENEATFSRLIELFEEMYHYLREKGLRVGPVTEGGKLWLDGIKNSLDRFHHVPVAFDEESPVAFAQGSLKVSPSYLGNRLTGSIEHIYVAPEYRRLGIGEQLIRMLEERFREKKVQFIDLDVHWNNEAGLGFWRSIGYEEELVTCRKLLE